MKIIIRNLQTRIPISPIRIKRVIRKTLTKETLHLSGEITILCVNDYTIRELNAKYLRKSCPTDVIAFTLTDAKKSGVLLGDVVISTDTALRNSRTFGTTPLYELYLYVIHGVLHLLGYDDKTAKERRRMQKKAEAILSALKITGIMGTLT